MKRIVFFVTVFGLMISLLSSQSPSQFAFEVATIKLQDPRTLRRAGGSCHGTDTVYPANALIVPLLGRCLITFSLSSLMSLAYSPVTAGGSVWRTTGGPNWVDSDFWLVEGKAEDETRTTEAELKQMLQTLLTERFKLQFHRETKEVDGFVLVVAKGGLKITEDREVSSNNGPSMSAGPAGLIYRKAPLSMFANYLSGPVGAPVIDKTGLIGPYSFTFQPPPPQPLTTSDNSDFGSPSIFTAIQEQLGLRLESAKVPMDLFVIDHVERPTPN